MINKLIIDTVAPLGVPVKFHKYSGKANTYITFHEYFSDGDAYDDDEETMTGHYIQVDVWSKSDYSMVVGNLKQLLIEAGFKRLNEVDLYEKDTKLYHKAIKFYYLEEMEVE